MRRPGSTSSGGNTSHRHWKPSPSHRPADTAGSDAPVMVTAHFLVAVVVVLWLGSGIGAPLLAPVPGVYRWAIAAAWIAASLLSLRHAAELATSAWPLLLFVGLAVIAVPSSDETGQAHLQNLAYMIVVYCIYSFYSAPAHHRYRRLIVGTVLLDLGVVAVRTWSALDTNPEVSRYLATGNVHEEIVAQTADLWGIGGYQQAYALPAIMLVFLHHGLTGRRYRAASWIIVALGTMLLVRMAFTIAVIMWVAFGLLLLAGETIGRRHQGGVIVAGLCGLPIGVLLGPILLSALAETGWLPGVVTVRLREMAALLTGEHNSDTDLAARFELYTVSLREFLKNWFSGSAGYGAGMGQLGTHSSWLDTLGAFGLISLLLFMFLYQAFRHQLSSIAPRKRFVFKLAWAYFIALGLVNTLLFAYMLLVWFVLLPFMLQLSGEPPQEDRRP